MHLHTDSKQVLSASFLFLFFWDRHWVKVRLEFHYKTALMTRLRALHSHNLNI